MNILLKYKKIFLSIGLIITSIAIGYLIYFLFFFTDMGVPKNKIDVKKQEITPSGFPESGEGSQKNQSSDSGEKIPDSKNIEQSDKTNTLTSKTSDLNDSASLGIALNQNRESLRYYNQDNGKFYKIDDDGEAIELSEQVFHNVDKINWQPQKNKAIIEYPDGTNIIYDFDTEKQTTIPKHWDDFGFSPNGDNIILESIGLDPNNRWLVVADDNGKNTQIIEKIGLNNETLHPNWSPNRKIIAMYTKGVGLNRQEVFFIGLNGENFKSMIVEGRNFDSIWSPSGDKLLYSVYSTDNDLKPKLWTVNATPEDMGTKRKSLGVDTWVNKCTFVNNEEAYCGVPKNLEDGAGMFPELAENTIDELYKVNIQTGKKKRIYALEGEYNISEIIISEDGNNIYFTDRLTQRIHKVEL